MMAFLFMMVASATGLAICILIAEFGLARNGIPGRDRIISLNGFASFGRVMFYHGEHRGLRHVHLAITWARAFAVLFFAALIAKVFIYGL